MNSYDFENGAPVDPGDLALLGSAPDLPLAQLNLAGIDGAPSPQDLAHPDLSMKLNMPDYIEPDMCPVSLKAGDLAAAELIFVPEFEPDPDRPDLRAIPVPYAVDQYEYDLMNALPNIADHIPDDAEIQAALGPGYGFPGLAVSHDVIEPDPPLPDLQHPDLTQEVEMQPEDRPGEMDDDALDVMKAGKDYEDGAASHDYLTSYMDQSGDNSHRARKVTLLDSGLDGDL
jgi:hypothetical protein